MSGADDQPSEATPPGPTAVPRRKESWGGVVVTAILCGVFLWWWFRPPGADATTERDPSHWLDLARREIEGQEPGPGMRLEIVMIAEALRAHGDLTGADGLEAAWLPAAWRDDGRGPPVFSPPPDPALSEVEGNLAGASQAVDELEIERGQAMLREAADRAAAVPEPSRTRGLWRVMARQARCGFSSDAAATRHRLGAGGAALPTWLVAEILEAEIVGPVLTWLDGRPAGDAEAPAIVQLWRWLVRDRIVHRDQGWLARDGSSADAAGGDPDARSAALRAITEAVDANTPGWAGRLAGQSPAGEPRAHAYLVIARRLAWLSTPAPESARDRPTASSRTE